VSCKHATRVGENAIKCGLNLFGGLPSLGVCRTCEHYEGGDGNPIPAPLPNALEMVKNFTKAAGRWADAGFPTVTENVHDARAAICESCEEWDGKARMGAGKCNACGCTGLKRWLATESCPLKKW